MSVNQARGTIAAFPGLPRDPRVRPGSCPVQYALEVLRVRLGRRRFAVETPEDALSFFILELAEEPNEIFGAMWLDSHNRFLDWSRLFRGTVSETPVYPRVVVQDGLRLNAAACILAHNHPAGVALPSEADLAITRKLRDALALFDIVLLDHVVVAGDEAFSFRGAGLAL